MMEVKTENFEPKDFRNQCNRLPHVRGGFFCISSSLESMLRVKEKMEGGLSIPVLAA